MIFPCSERLAEFRSHVVGVCVAEVGVRLGVPRAGCRARAGRGLIQTLYERKGI